MKQNQQRDFKNGESHKETVHFKERNGSKEDETQPESRRDNKYNSVR